MIIRKLQILKVQKLRALDLLQQKVNCAQLADWTERQDSVTKKKLQN